jgi:spore coat polysaccharide biosynthesis protein SpsF
VKIGLLITARLKSTRLPRKVLRPIHGRPMLAHMIDRLKLAKRPSAIILCTSTLEEDEPLAALAVQERVECYRGDPDDVLQRLTDAAREFAIDTVISCTADNPFVDPEYIDRLADLHIAEHNDFTRVEGLPFGTFSYALSTAAMLQACQIKDAKDTEVWGPYFTETGVFRAGVLQVTDPAVRRPELRLTVDTPEDFAVVCGVFDALHEEGKVFSLRQIVQLCDQHPELAGLNAHISQKAAKPIRVKRL